MPSLDIAAQASGEAIMTVRLHKEALEAVQVEGNFLCHFLRAHTDDR
jgi:hypothetical protein